MKKFNARWQLVIYDILILFVVDLLLLVFYRSNEELSLDGIVLHAGISFVCVFTARIFGSIYRQIWRYGGIQCYIRLLIVDAIAFAATLAIELTLPRFVSIEKVTCSMGTNIRRFISITAMAMKAMPSTTSSRI